MRMKHYVMQKTPLADINILLGRHKQKRCVFLRLTIRNIDMFVDNTYGISCVVVGVYVPYVVFIPGLCFCVCRSVRSDSLFLSALWE